jgi:hypothetical protein
MFYKTENQCLGAFLVKYLTHAAVSVLFAIVLFDVERIQGESSRNPGLLAKGCFRCLQIVISDVV